MRLSALACGFLLLSPGLAYAWGNEGHQIIATIAMDELTPAVRAKVGAMLAADTSSLTAHDIASEATWADAYRGAGHRETAAWHFVDDEIDHAPDMKAACFGFPTPDQPPSSGPAQDCVVDKIEEFRGLMAQTPGVCAIRPLFSARLFDRRPLHRCRSLSPSVRSAAP